MDTEASRDASTFLGAFPLSSTPGDTTYTIRSNLSYMRRSRVLEPDSQPASSLSCFLALLPPGTCQPCVDPGVGAAAAGTPTNSLLGVMSAWSPTLRLRLMNSAAKLFDLGVLPRYICTYSVTSPADPSDSKKSTSVIPSIPGKVCICSSHHCLNSSAGLSIFILGAGGCTCCTCCCACWYRCGAEACWWYCCCCCWGAIWRLARLG
mmetsp:Transcript_6095/g.10561  ORF Transcript_6095/g.10561 Transcript_6095/m.10561 type:complete len:207 (-) Transcript_6095:1036-1656(-)